MAKETEDDAWTRNFNKFRDACIQKYGATEETVAMYGLVNGFDEMAFESYSDAHIELLVEQAKGSF